MNGKRLLLAIGVVAFVIIVSIAIFSIDWGGGGGGPIGKKPVNIADYATTDVQVRMSVRGEINNNQEHEDMTITVGRDQTVANLLTGYEGAVKLSESTGNNPVSYKAFLSALHNESFTKEKLPPAGIQYDGACPNGKRYTFEFLNGGDDAPKSLWATTCGKKVGTFDGDLTAVKNLFEAQVPSNQLKTLTTASSQF